MYKLGSEQKLPYANIKAGFLQKFSHKGFCHYFALFSATPRGQPYVGIIHYAFVAHQQYLVVFYANATNPHPNLVSIKI